jgi:SAM-dependent methyltransferase
MKGYVGVQHAFHDAEFVQGWSDRFVPTEPRLRLFDMILEQVENLGRPEARVLELGTGPGYMARHILQRNSAIRYEALDFSDAFLEVARKTLGELASRVVFTNADLTDQHWPEQLASKPDAIISTWALHDLGGQEPVRNVYARCFELLAEGGVLVNGDFIKPDGTSWDYEPGRFETGRHLDLLREAGFNKPKSIAHLEPNIENPTPAQNYACFVAFR